MMDHGWDYYLVHDTLSVECLEQILSLLVCDFFFFFFFRNDILNILLKDQNRDPERVRGVI